MDALIAHVQANWEGYLIVVLCLIPILYILRQYTGPILFYIVEIIFYLGIFHAVTWGVVRAFAWFREASSFQNVDTSGAVTQVPMSTPFVRFWDQALYNPEGLFYFEAIVAVLIVIGVAYFRPMNYKGNRYKGKEAAPGKRGRYQYRGGKGRAARDKADTGRGGSRYAQGRRR